jgi:hypothetical protein
MTDLSRRKRPCASACASMPAQRRGNRMVRQQYVSQATAFEAEQCIARRLGAHRRRDGHVSFGFWVPNSSITAFPMATYSSNCSRPTARLDLERSQQTMEFERVLLPMATLRGARLRRRSIRLIAGTRDKRRGFLRPVLARQRWRGAPHLRPPGCLRALRRLRAGGNPRPRGMQAGSRRCRLLRAAGAEYAEPPATAPTSSGRRPTSCRCTCPRPPPAAPWPASTRHFERIAERLRNELPLRGRGRSLHGL